MAAKKRRPARAVTPRPKQRAQRRRKPRAKPASKPGARSAKAERAPTGKPAEAALIGPQGEIATVVGGPEVERQAARWMYVLRNRSRWTHDEDLREALQARARKDLNALGVSNADLEALAGGRVVEVMFALEGRDQASADALVSMPWEYLLSVATRAVGRVDPILITRLLPTALARGPSARLKRVVMLESAPGRLADTYDFESEEDRIRAALGSEIELKVLETMSLTRYSELIRASAPDVLHLSGVDNHQAPPLLDEDFDTLRDRVKGDDPPPTPEQERRGDGPDDGMMIVGRGGSEVPVAFQHIAAVIQGLDKAPVVTLNLYYSACRTAPAFIRAGARAVLGFFDEVDDELAESFLQELFWQLRELKDLEQFPIAFDRAWVQVTQYGHDLHGTGIVLWTASSVFPHVARTIAERHEARVREAAIRRRQPASASIVPVPELLRVELAVPEEINYSLLHNERPLLRKLTLTKLVNHVLDDIAVQVELNAGAQSYQYRYTEVELTQPQLALAEKVVIPLTADLLRSLREVVQSTAYVRVTVGGRVAFEETRRVRLLPVDQWYDDTVNNPWLPSFVLPRDPAVARIISAARRHLITLQDDPEAGFDGYQSVNRGDPKSCEIVDLQVRAIWTAIVNDLDLMYVNPPPAYSERNQRLRTPSEILTTESGTCIDLALLLASCLEYVEIFPVVVLLEGHAFVGYWCSEEGHDLFRALDDLPDRYSVRVGEATRNALVPLVDARNWRLSQQHYDEIRHRARKGDLRFLEATGLSFGYSFAEALEEGAANMRSRADFDSLLDVRLARLATPAVTPLPIGSQHLQPRGEGS